MSRVRLAIVGCGSSTERGLLLHLMLEPGLVEVAALVDTSEIRLKELSEKFDIPKKSTFSSLEEMLNSSDAEAVAIATPIPLHYSQALAPLRHKRHVHIQNIKGGIHASKDDDAAGI